MTYHTLRAPRQAARPPRPIDLVHLARQTMGNRDLECQALRLYSRQIASCLERVQTGRDRLEVLMGLSTLKAASRSAGAMRLAEMAEAAERDLDPAGDLDPETIADLAMAVAETSGYIERLLAD